MSTSMPLRDADTRRRIGPWDPDGLPSLRDFEPDTNFFVRAAAGSGKTTALVGRMIALIRSGVPIDECTAITFTRKAASEMKARLYKELRATEQQLRQNRKSVGDELERVRQAQNDLPRCFIGTIHSFCARLLRERPLTAGLSPDFTAGIDERQRESLRNKTWQSYLSEVWQTSNGKIDHIASLGVEPAELVNFFGELCRYPDLSPYVDGPDTPPDLEETVDQLETFVAKWIGALPENPGDGDARPGKTANALRKADRFRQFRSFTDPATRAEFISLFAGLTKTDARKSTETEVRGRLTLSHWLDRDAAETLDNSVLPALVHNVVEPALKKWKAYVHRQLVEFTRPAIKRYAERRRESGQLTFQDLLLRARTLLRDHPEARQALQSEYPRLLVDEFQDTDPIQAELLSYLTSKNPTTRNWRQCRPRDGSLFIVGDDKQSIYRFRRADLDVYRTVREIFEDAPNGEDVTLKSNFRSVAPILEWCNEAFGDIFSNMESPYQTEYVDFDAARTERPSEPAVRELRVPYVKGSSYSTDIANRNAAQVADYIAAACSSPNPLLRDANGTGLVEGSPGDFMILTRVTSRLDQFAEALAERGLPYTLAGGKDVKASAELRALLTLLTCVERPHDSVARIAYLRGPLVGLSDDTLYRYRKAGGQFDGPFNVDSTVANVLDSKLVSRLGTAYEHLRQAREWLNGLRPAAAIERVVDRLGLASRARRESGLGSLHAGRLLRILTDVQELDAEGYTWTTIRDELQQVLDGDRELDGVTLDTGADDAVRLLNVHKAKGLQAPVVFLADPYGGGSQHGPSQHVWRDEGEVVLPVYEEHRFNRTLRYAPERWAEEFEDVETKYENAEKHRLLYVATTRAQELLIVSRYTAESWDKDKGYWAPLYPYLNNCPEVRLPDEFSSIETAADNTETQTPTLENRLHRVSRPTFSTSTVTIPSSGPSVNSKEGYGKAFGRAMHELFAHLIRHRKRLDPSSLPDSLVDGALRKHDVDAHRDTALTMLRAFIEGPIWADLTDARTIHVEYPVSGLQTEGSEIPNLVSGTVDLLYKISEEWHLVDYKTDRLEADPAELVEAYGPQLAAYASLWEEATDTSIHKKGLWLADAGEFVSV